MSRAAIKKSTRTFVWGKNMKEHLAYYEKMHRGLLIEISRIGTTDYVERNEAGLIGKSTFPESIFELSAQATEIYTQKILPLRKKIEEIKRSQV